MAAGWGIGTLNVLLMCDELNSNTLPVCDVCSWYFQERFQTGFWTHHFILTAIFVSMYAGKVRCQFHSLERWTLGLYFGCFAIFWLQECFHTSPTMAKPWPALLWLVAMTMIFLLWKILFKYGRWTSEYYIYSWKTQSQRRNRLKSLVSVHTHQFYLYLIIKPVNQRSRKKVNPRAKQRDTSITLQLNKRNVMWTVTSHFHGRLGPDGQKYVSELKCDWCGGSGVCRTRRPNLSAATERH